MIEQTIDEDEQRRRVAVLSLATKDAEIARLTRERDEARVTAVERKTEIARLEQELMLAFGRVARAETERDEASRHAAALARHAARAKGDG